MKVNEFCNKCGKETEQELDLTKLNEFTDGRWWTLLVCQTCKDTNTHFLTVYEQQTYLRRSL